MKLPHIQNPIRMVAVVCATVISIYVMWMGWKINEVLAGPTWCARAIGADKADSNSRVDAAGSCISLLTIQLRSLATNSHILFAVIALCLLALIVIVIAGGRLAFAASRTGISGSMSSAEDEAAAAAAAQTADAAVTEATKIAADGAKPAAPPATPEISPKPLT